MTLFVNTFYMYLYMMVSTLLNFGTFLNTVGKKSLGVGKREALGRFHHSCLKSIPVFRLSDQNKCNLTNFHTRTAQRSYPLTNIIAWIKECTSAHPQIRVGKRDCSGRNDKNTIQNINISD